MTRAVAIGIGALLAFVGCSSDGDILPKKERFTPAPKDAGPDAAIDVTNDAADNEPDAALDAKKPRDPNANCVKPGTPNNERGVGGYCEPGRGDCTSDAGPRFCTADFRDIAPVNDDKWFCSTVCTMDEECGSGAICSTAAVGSGCAPIICVGDAGVPTAPVGTNLSR